MVELQVSIFLEFGSIKARAAYHYWVPVLFFLLGSVGRYFYDM